MMGVQTHKNTCRAFILTDVTPDAGLFSLSDLTREPRTVALTRAANGSVDIHTDGGLEGAADFDFGTMDGSGDFPANGDGLAT